MEVLWFVVALMVWMNVKERVLTHAYHHPESPQARAWAGAFTWLSRIALLWVLLSYLDSAEISLSLPDWPRRGETRSE